LAGGSGKAGAVYEEVNAKEEATETSIRCPGSHSGCVQDVASLQRVGLRQRWPHCDVT
jgi:hypothetical protein